MKHPHLSALIRFSFLFVALAVFASLAGGAPQGPPLPEGVGADQRLTWRPQLAPTATVTVDDLGVITDWRSGSPVTVPSGGREPLIVAVELLQNDAGQWVGLLGDHGSLKLGARTDKDEASRPQGFAGISVVGLGDDPSGASLAGFALAQYAGGRQRDLALINLTIDSWTNRPCTTAAGGHPDYGHLYLERIDLLSIANDLARQDALGPHVDPSGATWKTAKAGASTTWLFRLEGYVRSHFLQVRMVGGVAPGDGLAGASEHGAYQNGPAGDSEFVECEFHGCQISALYFVTRFADRIVGPNGDPIAERWGAGRLLIEDLFAHDCGVNGSFAVNICGGLLDVTVRGYHYRVNQDGYALSGHVPGGKWAGGALQAYCDHKAYELVPPISSQSKPVALGYSLESGLVDQAGAPLPMSDGVQALVDAGRLPWDGYGAARSITIVGGLYEVANLTPPLMHLRDVALVTVVQRDGQVQPWTVRGLGAGKALAFGGSGLRSQCGPAEAAGAGPGLVPSGLPAGWNQQARFVSRPSPASWLGGKVHVGGQAVSPAELATWLWRP